MAAPKRTGAQRTRPAALLALLLSWGHSAAKADTLGEALASAYKQNARLDAARAQQRAVDEEIARARSGFQPSITGTATTGYQNTAARGTASLGAGELSPSSYAVGLVQPIFRGFRTLNAVKGAEAGVSAGQQTLRATEQAVLLEAVTAYANVLRDQTVARLRETNAMILGRDVDSTRERHRLGEVTRTDLAQALARRAAAVSALDLARATLQASLADYARVIGQPAVNLKPPQPTRLLPKSLPEAMEIAARESPAIVAALYREQGARVSVDTIRGELLPTVQVEASYGKSYGTSQTTRETEQTSVLARLSVPFYSGGEVEARVRQAKHTHVQRLQEIEQTRTEQLAQVTQSWSSMIAAKAQLEADKAGAEANRIALDGVREEERNGQRTVLDVLNAQLELLNAEINLANDRRNLVVASYSVLAAVGRLNVQELAVTESVYDAEGHAQEVRRKWLDLSITHADGRRETATAR